MNSSNPTSQLRVVILDYPKLQLENQNCKKFLSDIVTAREIGYQKASDSYVAVDKLDIIGTHILLYDTSDLLSPRLISGLRLSHSDRCEKHRLVIPMDDNIQHASLATKELYRAYKAEKKVLVESNGWFVDPDYSFAKSKVDIAQVLCCALGTYLIRQGRGHFMTATNERFKASRRVTFGAYEDGHFFTHPAMPDPHKVILIKDFSMEWMKQSYEQYGDLLRGRQELYPSEMSLSPFEDVVSEIYNAAELIPTKVAA